MSTWYEVLQVAPGAEPEVVEAAYQALRRKYEGAGPEAEERLAGLGLAYRVLSDPTSRAAYDRQLSPDLSAIETPAPGDLPLAPEAAVASAPPSVSAPAPSPPRPRWMLAALGGMVLLLLGLSAAAAVYYWQSRDGDEGAASYPVDRDDTDYDLEAMSLEDIDVPEGMESVLDEEFDNEEVAQTFQEADPEAKRLELEALGRRKARVQIYSWTTQAQYIENLAKLSNIYSQSTLFQSEEKAGQSLRLLCDLQQYPPNRQVEEFKVPRLAQESTAFTITHEDATFSKLVDTAICFRTGRIVHSVIRSGLQGTEDREDTIRLARAMLRRVDEAFIELGN